MKEVQKLKSHKFLTDIMTEEDYKFICELNGVVKFITAGTGAGKTHWLINKFCKDNARNSKVLILCNRSALKDQTIHEFGKANESMAATLKELGFRDFTNDILIRIEYGNVDIRTYHSLVNISVEELNNYDHIICDECHFLLQDSMFNENCEEITEKLLTLMKGCGRNLIMITATELEILRLLNYVGYSEENGNLRLFDYNKSINSFDRIDFVCCAKSLNVLMENIPNNEKCLVFTRRSKKNIKELASKFSNADYVYSRWVSDKKSGFFSSDTEMELKHKKLIETGMFESKYLIANSSIDNGISFHDPALRTIIIDNIFDMVQIIQMIGRKRFDFNNDNDRLTVFLVSNNNNAKREYDLLTEISDMIKYYIDNMNTEQTLDKKIEFDDNWRHLIGDVNKLTSQGKITKQIAVYRKVENFEEKFYIRRYSALKVLTNQEFLKRILSIPIEIANANIPESMKTVSGLNFRLAMDISKTYGKDINTIEIDNGKRNTNLKKKAEIQYNLDYELQPYIESLSDKEYLFGEDKDTFIATMQYKFGAGDSEKHHKNLRITSINEVIKNIGYMIISKSKKIKGKTETIWIIEKI